MELRNVEETVHIRKEIGMGSLKASGSVRYVCCGLLFAGRFLGLPKGGLSSSFIPKHGEQFVN